MGAPRPGTSRSPPSVTEPSSAGGRPEATHLIERVMDLVAYEVGMDPADVRRKNFIAKNEFPYTNLVGLIYDSGDYAATLDKALAMVGYQALRKQQAELRKQGRYLGIGLSTYVEICGVGPSGPTVAATGVGLWGSAG